MTDRISAKTLLVGLIAEPIRHSLSPTMHNEAFIKLGLDYAYLAFEVGNDNLEDAVKGIRGLGLVGSNVSMPNKQKILPYLDELSPAAKLTGTVNTVVNVDGVLTGHITDGTGFMMSLKDAGVDVIGKKMTLFGAGGAGTAIAVQAALDGVKEISIFNRKDEFFENAENTVKIINENTECKAYLYDLADKGRLRQEISSSYILANATGVGMKGDLQDESLVPDASMLRPELVVADAVYMPPRTKLLQMADEVGCMTVEGIGMMIYQGAAAFKLFTGHDMPVDYIKELFF